MEEDNTVFLISGICLLLVIAFIYFFFDDAPGKTKFCMFFVGVAGVLVICGFLPLDMPLGGKPRTPSTVSTSQQPTTSYKGGFFGVVAELFGAFFDGLKYGWRRGYGGTGDITTYPSGHTYTPNPTSPSPPVQTTTHIPKPPLRRPKIVIPPPGFYPPPFVTWTDPQPQQVPSVAYHGTSKEAAYHILATALFKIRNGSPAGLWVTTHFDTALEYALNANGDDSDGLIVQLKLSFSSSQIVDTSAVNINSGDPNQLSKSLLARGTKIIRIDDTVFCILGEYTDDNEYVAFPGVTPIRLLDKYRNPVA